MTSFLGILLLVKTVLSFAVLLLDTPMEELALMLFEPLRSHPELELSVVMILAPWLLNSAQFWVLDNVSRTLYVSLVCLSCSSCQW